MQHRSCGKCCHLRGLLSPNFLLPLVPAHGGTLFKWSCQQSVYLPLPPPIFLSFCHASKMITRATTIDVYAILWDRTVRDKSVTNYLPELMLLDVYVMEYPLKIRDMSLTNSKYKLLPLANTGSGVTSLQASNTSVEFEYGPSRT